MRNTILASLALLTMLVACGRQPLSVLPDGGSSDAAGGAGGHVGGSGGVSGAAGMVLLRLPDGGLPALLGDSGILGGILDAPRDSLLGQVFCGPEAKFGASCSADTPGCLLPSLGGACLCVSGTYLCPLDTKQGPVACPKGAATGTTCLSPMSVCIGGGANGCICGLGSYVSCF
jgi:hypothetical protein